MAYVALKPCKFAGQIFKIGERVPEEAILPGAASNLVKMGIIADESEAKKTEETAGAATEISVNVQVDGDAMRLDLTPEGLQAVFDVLTKKVGEAEATINGMTDPDALILLNLADSRKTVKELTETRGKALSEALEGVESEGEL